MPSAARDLLGDVLLGIVAAVAMALLLPRGTGASARRRAPGGAFSAASRPDLPIIMLMLMLCQFVPYTYIRRCWSR